MNEAIFLCLFLAGWCAALCLAGLVCVAWGWVVQAINNAVDVEPPQTYIPASLRELSEEDV